MTKLEWQACTDPTRMIEFLGINPSERKWRLFTVACCRRINEVMTDPRSLAAVDFAELFADGIDVKRFTEVARAAHEVSEGIEYDPEMPYDLMLRTHLASFAASAASFCLDAGYVIPTYRGDHILNPTTRYTHYQVLNTLRYILDAVEYNAPIDPGADYISPHVSWMARESEQVCQCLLLHEIFGNPFRPVQVDTSWLTTNVVTLAQTIYDQKMFHLVPILGDALQDAGCTHDDVLNHCRDTDHVRGCWVIDLLLGKS
jgi:hypothetical protein